MRILKTAWVLPVLSLLAVSAIPVLVHGDNPRLEFLKPSVTLYDGSLFNKEKVKIGEWASGKVRETALVQRNGNKTLEIRSKSLYDGARIDFGEPLDLSVPFNDPDAYLQVAVKLDQNASRATGRTLGGPGGMFGGGGMPGMGMPGMGGPGAGVGGKAGPGGMRGMGGKAGGAMPGMGMPGMGMPGMGMPRAGVGGKAGPGGMRGMGGKAGGNVRGGAAGRAGAGMPGMGMPGMGGPGAGVGGRSNRTGRGSGVRIDRPTRRVRVLLQFEDGKAVECQARMADFKMANDGWYYLTMPLSSFKGGLDIKNYRVKRVVVGGDGNQPFYLAEVYTTQETTTLQAHAGQDQAVAKNDEVIVSGSSDAGPTAVEYYWDFDQSDGIQVEAIGRTAKHKYRRGGEFVVTLTVKDPYGKKEPAQSTLKVKVYD